MGSCASVQANGNAANAPAQSKEAPPPVEKPAEDKAKVVDSEITTAEGTATPPADDVAPVDDEAAKLAKEKKEEEDAAVKIQAIHKGNKARKEVAALNADKGEPAAEEPAQPVATEEPALTEEEKKKQEDEEAAAALKIQANHRGKQARREVEKLKESTEGSAQPQNEEATTTEAAEATPAEAPPAETAPADETAEAKAAREAAEEEAAALKIQSIQKGNKARKEVDALKKEASEAKADA